MAENTTKVKDLDWNKFVKMGLEKLIKFWKDGEIKSRDFRLVTTIFSFFKSMDLELKKQTKLLIELVKQHDRADVDTTNLD